MAISKMTSHQLNYSRAVIAAGRSHLDALADALGKTYSAYTKERIDQTRALVSFHCDLLKQVASDYEAAANNLAQDESEDIFARAERTDAAEQLSRLLSACRSRIRENLGDDALRIYRLDRTTPVAREALRRYGAEVLNLLEQNPRTAADLFGDTFSTATLAAKLGAAVTTLQIALQTVAREQRETQTARARRNQAEVHFRTTVSNIAAILEAHLRLAGLTEQADRIRPTYARTSGESGPPSEPGEPDGAPDDAPNSVSPDNAPPDNTQYSVDA